MRCLLGTKKTQSKDLTLTNRKKVWSYCISYGWIAREVLEGSRFRSPSTKQVSSSWILVSPWTAAHSGNPRMALLKFLQKHKAICEARLCSKQTSDPIHSDIFWQKERTPGKSRWSMWESCSTRSTRRFWIRTRAEGTVWWRAAGREGQPRSSESSSWAHSNFLTPTSGSKVIPLTTWDSEPGTRNVFVV